MFGRPQDTGIGHVSVCNIRRPTVGNVAHRVPPTSREARVESVVQSDFRLSGRRLRGFPGEGSKPIMGPKDATLYCRKSRMRES
jgi:hypothetical protein